MHGIRQDFSYQFLNTTVQNTLYFRHKNDYLGNIQKPFRILRYIKI